MTEPTTSDRTVALFVEDFWGTTVPCDGRFFLRLIVC